MKKNKEIIKEIFILTLVCIAIACVLSVILYMYSPTSKFVPSKVSYSTPENVSQEISSTNEIETVTPVTITYELDETNIDNSKKNGSYDPGKRNPFEKVETENTEDSQNQENTNDKNTNSTTSTSNSSNTSSNSTNTTSYLPETGTK